MPDHPDPVLLEQLKAHLEYYAETGIDRFDPKAVSGAVRLAAAAHGPRKSRAPRPQHSASSTQASLFAESGPESVRDSSLEEVRDDLGDCQRCKLCQDRTHIVFGDGNPGARLVFVGEGPGNC